MTLEEKIAQMYIFHMQTKVLPDETVELDETNRALLANGIGGLGSPLSVNYAAEHAKALFYGW